MLKLFKPSKNDDIQPENVPEKVVWWAIANTYYIWVFGGLYVVGSVMGWVLLLFLIIKILAQTKDTPPEEKITISWIIWVWIVGMFFMQVALIAGHLDFNLPTSLIIKSSIGWAKGWAALALYPLAGCLKIRPNNLSGCLHCRFSYPHHYPFFTINTLSAFTPNSLRFATQSSRGPGNEFFDVPLYEIDGSTGDLRWRLFTPWLDQVLWVMFTLCWRCKKKIKNGAPLD